MCNSIPDEEKMSNLKIGDKNTKTVAINKSDAPKDGDSKAEKDLAGLVTDVEQTWSQNK